jgi:hypothetical protein
MAPLRPFVPSGEEMTAPQLLAQIGHITEFHCQADALLRRLLNPLPPWLGSLFDGLQNAAVCLWPALFVRVWLNAYL